MSNFQKKKKIKTPIFQSFSSPFFVCLLPHLPTFPSLWSVLGSAMMACTATMASLILVCSSRSSSMCSRRRIWAASFRVASGRKSILEPAVTTKASQRLFSHLIQEQTHSPPVSKPRACLSKVTGTPCGTKKAGLNQTGTKKSPRSEKKSSLNDVTKMCPVYWMLLQFSLSFFYVVLNVYCIEDAAAILSYTMYDDHNRNSIQSNSDSNQPGESSALESQI